MRGKPFTTDRFDRRLALVVGFGGAPLFSACTAVFCRDLAVAMSPVKLATAVAASVLATLALLAVGCVGLRTAART